MLLYADLLVMLCSHRPPLLRALCPLAASPLDTAPSGNLHIVCSASTLKIDSRAYVYTLHLSLLLAMNAILSAALARCSETLPNVLAGRGSATQ